MTTAVFSDAYSWLYSQSRAGRQRGPARVRELLGALGNPQKQFQVIRVVGTNGKGSTCAMLEAGLLAAGVRVGRFTSPHLSRFEERVRIAGEELSPERTQAFVAQMRRWQAQGHLPPVSFFDLSLALACQAFAQSGVQWAVMEAGVGGESDATHALEGVQAVLLTGVAADHLDALGPTLAHVARDKAGAAVRGRPLLSVSLSETKTVAAVAAQRGAPLLTPALAPELFALPRPPALAGPHQARNASLALAALRTLAPRLGLNPHTLEQAEQAALSAQWPARLERFAVQGREVWLDGAHNPDAALALRAALPQADTLLFAALGRKDGQAVLEILRAGVSSVLLTAPSREEASLSAHGELSAHFGDPAEPDPVCALQKAIAQTPLGGRLLIAGSLHLAGTIRPLLLQCALGGSK